MEIDFQSCTCERSEKLNLKFARRDLWPKCSRPQPVRDQMPVTCLDNGNQVPLLTGWIFKSNNKKKKYSEKIFATWITFIKLQAAGGFLAKKKKKSKKYSNNKKNLDFGNEIVFK